MSLWYRKKTKVMPSLEDENDQRILWQNRCDELLDWLLCDKCIRQKDDAFARGMGLDWEPDDCDDPACMNKMVQYTFRRGGEDPLYNVTYADELPECMLKFCPIR